MATFKADFGVGDSFFVMDKNKVRELTIDSVYFRGDGRVSYEADYKYHGQNTPVMKALAEYQIFKTKEDLLKSL